MKSSSYVLKMKCTQHDAHHSKHHSRCNKYIVDVHNVEPQRDDHTDGGGDDMRAEPAFRDSGEYAYDASPRCGACDACRVFPYDDVFGLLYPFHALFRGFAHEPEALSLK